MKIIAKYFFQEYITFFVLCLMIFISIFLVIDFLQRIDNFIEAQVPSGMIFFYFIYKVPHITVQMIPVGSLIAVIIMLSLMQKRNEITALKACGLDILRLSSTIMIIGLAIGIVSFLLGEVLVPYTSSKSNEIWNLEVEKYNPAHFYGNDQIWYKSHNAIYWIKYFDSHKNILENPVFFFFDDDFHLTKRIDGQRALWQNGMWKIEHGIIQTKADKKSYQLSKFNVLFLKIPETPETFKKGIKRPEDMSYQQLKSFARSIGQEGYDNTRYIVDMNMKFSTPLTSLILILIGIPIALGSKKGGIPLAVSMGVGICFVFFVSLGLSRSLGLSGALPPVLSAWVAHMIFLSFGLFLMMRVER
jgi:lipopolysaccharide export system permease protein